MALSEVTWIDLPHVPDERGVLTSIESGLDIPFEVRRIFFMHAIRGERGAHAHRVTRQLLLPVAGEFKVRVSDGSKSGTYHMADPNRALYLPPMVWVRLYEFGPNAVCLVLADTHYVDDTYIHDWDEFLRASRGVPPA
ncbi:MAG TPA: FdtA/QdtA family cupin domain-containing protein [Burkholderiales bacterium]